MADIAIIIIHNPRVGICDRHGIHIQLNGNICLVIQIVRCPVHLMGGMDQQIFAAGIHADTACIKGHRGIAVGKFCLTESVPVFVILCNTENRKSRGFLRIVLSRYQKIVTFRCVESAENGKLLRDCFRRCEIVGRIKVFCGHTLDIPSCLDSHESIFGKRNQIRINGSGPSVISLGFYITSGVFGTWRVCSVDIHCRNQTEYECQAQTQGKRFLF